MEITENPQPVKKDTIAIKKSTIMIVAFIIVALLIGYFIGSFTATGKAAGVGQQANPQGSSNPETNPANNTAGKIDASLGINQVLGNANAPVAIVEFSDFQCSFCARFVEQTFPQIKADYIDTGKVRFVFRNFPLSFHENAEKAAEAAECANEQGKFWEYHDILFKNNANLSVTNYKQWTADLSLDTAKFNNCLDSSKYASAVTKDTQDGQAAGITGTPSFIINGAKLVGAQPYSAFKAAIDAALSK